MGSAQSSHAGDKRNTNGPEKAPAGKASEPNVSGRKSIENETGMETPMKTPELVIAEPEQAVATDDDSTEFDDEDYESEEEDEYDEEYEEFMKEREAILADARRLKQLATFFAHPEAPVEVEATATARCFFDRASAEPQQDEDDVEEMEEEKELIMQDLQQLKQLAVAYMHPEKPCLTTDPTACARSYYSRFSAPSQEDAEEAEERARILQDAAALKSQAEAYMHPEKPCVTTDPFACGRNYYSRPEAFEPETEDLEERQAVLADAAALKQSAKDWLHPERPVTVDPLSFGRNYYSRFSAPSQVDEEEAEERERILQEAAALKQTAKDWLHPERPVVVDPAAKARCYFDRASAPQPEDVDAVDEYEEEKELVLKDLQLLKTLAGHYMHPEKPVQVDPLSTARCYFDRFSAPDMEDEEDAEERARVLDEAKALKAQAIAYRKPEFGVTTSDPFACGRNYFSRASAPDTENAEEAEERAQIMADAAALKSQAVAWRHPERPCVTTDPLACARSWFDRPSSLQQESHAEAEERAQIMADAAAFKSQAVDYLHPERPVSVDPLAFGRNYYGRFSSPDQEDEEDAEERARVLAEAKSLKSQAMAYRHPEVGVKTTDSLACGRNFFDRASAPGHYEMIHTFPPHEDEIYHDDHHEEQHVDHFGLDEEMEMFEYMRHSIATALPQMTKAVTAAVETGDKEGGNLSRSPSSVFDPLGYDE